MEFPLGFREQSAKILEANYLKNPRDADNLTKWASVMIEISDQHDSSDSDAKRKLLHFAIEKLNESLLVDPDQHLAHYYLGNANVALAFLDDDCVKCYQNAAISYERACEVKPNNKLYNKLYKWSLKEAKSIKAEMQQLEEEFKNEECGLAQQAMASTGAKPAVSEEVQK